MLKYPRNHRTFSSNGDYVDQDTSIQSSHKPSYSFIIRTKSTGKTQRSPGLSLKLKNVHKTRFSKIMPKKYSFDHEKLSDDHWASRLKTSIFEEENFKLRNRLAELIQLQEIESNREIPKIKKKIRKLQNKLISREDEHLALKANIKSSNITEYENKIQNSLEEAKRLMYLLGKITSENPFIHFGESEGHKSQISNELQMLRKENLHLNKLTTQALHDLDILKTKLSTLEKHKQKKILKAKIGKFKIQKLEVQKMSDKLIEEFSITENDLSSKIFIQQEIHNNKLNELDLNERRLILQEKMINDMKQKLEMFKLASKAKRTQTFMSLKIREEVFTKLMNPPRLLVKIDQVLRKKKMIIAVFLSLIDKNNSGLMHMNAFIAGMKTYGLKIKPRHINEISKLLGSDFTYIPLRKIEEMFDKYKYDNAYKSSSSEDEGPKGMKNRKNHVVAPVVIIPPEVKKEEVKPLPSPIKVIEKTMPFVSVCELTGVLDEIKEKMYLSRLPKSKLVTALFGYDFDPDEGITIEPLMDFLSKSHLNLKNDHNNRLLARFLLESEGLKTIKESEIPKLKGTIRDFSRKLARILPDWEVFSDSEIETFRNILNTQMMKNYKRIVKAIEDIDKAQEKKIEFIRFQNLLRNLDINFSERMNFWIMMELGLKVKQDKFEYSSFLKKFDENEQSLNVKDLGFGRMNKSPRDSKGSIVVESLKSLVNRLNHTHNSCFFKIEDNLTAEEFTKLLYKVDMVIPPNTINTFINEFSVQGNRKSGKEIDMKSFSKKLKEAGLEEFVEEKNEIDGKGNKVQNMVEEKKIEVKIEMKNEDEDEGKVEDKSDMKKNEDKNDMKKIKDEDKNEEKKDLDKNIEKNDMDKNEEKDEGKNEGKVEEKSEEKNEIEDKIEEEDEDKNEDKDKDEEEDEGKYVKKDDNVDAEKEIEKRENIDDSEKNDKYEEHKKDDKCEGHKEVEKNEDNNKEKSENHREEGYDSDLENVYEKEVNQNLGISIANELVKDIEKVFDKSIEKGNEKFYENKKYYEEKEDHKEENDYEDDFYSEKEEESDFEVKNDLSQEEFNNIKDLKEEPNSEDSKNYSNEDYENEELENGETHNTKLQQNGKPQVENPFELSKSNSNHSIKAKLNFDKTIHKSDQNLEEPTKPKKEYQNTTSDDEKYQKINEELKEKLNNQAETKKISSNVTHSLLKTHRSDDYSEEPEEISEIHDNIPKFSSKSSFENSPKSSILF